MMRRGGTSSLADLILEKGRISQFLLLGDSDHESTEVTNALYSKETLVALKKAGFEKIGVEHLVFEQSAIDALTSNKITKSQFKDLLKASVKPHNNVLEIDNEIDSFADFVMDAKDLGIDVHAVDGSEGDYNVDLNNEIAKHTYEQLIWDAQISPDFKITKSLFEEVRQRITDEMKVSGLYGAMDYYQKRIDLLKLAREDYRSAKSKGDLVEEPEFYKSKRLEELPHTEREDGFDARMALDTPVLAQRIYKIADGKPMAIIYGSGHMAKKWDLDEELEKLAQMEFPDRTNIVSVINLYSSTEGRGIKEIKDFCREFACAASPEHINFYLLDKTFDHGNKGLELSALKSNREATMAY